MVFVGIEGYWGEQEINWWGSSIVYKTAVVARKT
jgi:hypothetical protein